MADSARHDLKESGVLLVRAGFIDVFLALGALGFLLLIAFSGIPASGGSPFAYMLFSMAAPVYIYAFVNLTVPAIYVNGWILVAGHKLWPTRARDVSIEPLSDVTHVIRFQDGAKKEHVKSVSGRVVSPRLPKVE